jgi:hypothetical protein
LWLTDPDAYPGGPNIYDPTDPNADQDS